MSFLSNNSIDSSGKILGILSNKQELLSANITNVHTPGYVRKDLNFADYLAGDSISSLEQKINKKYGRPAFGNEVGGTVSIQEEMASMQKNLLHYNMTTRRLNSAITELKTVTQVGK